MRTLITMIILLVAATMVPGAAQAHRLNVYAVPDGDRLSTEGYYMDGRPCAGCTIAIYDAKSDALLSRGVTDAEGILISPIPEASSIRVELTAPGGHKSEQLLALSSEGKAMEIKASSDNITENPAPGGGAVSESGTRACNCIEEKLASIHRELRHLRQASERPGITEIMGGIGYIIGIMGIWAYMKGRREGL